MNLLFEAIFPVFLLILLGYFFKRISFPSSDFWSLADKLTYYVLMPSLLVYKLSFAKIDEQFSFDMVYVGVGIITFIFFLFVVFRKLFSFSGASYTSIIQGGIRYNTYIFLAIVDAIYGDIGLVYGMVFITFAIPLINLFCISSFALFIQNDTVTYKKFLNSIVKNPLIIACLIGGVVNFSGLYIPIFVEKTLSILSSAALSMGLLSVGVGLEISHIRYAKMELFISSFVKLIVFPACMAISGYLFLNDNVAIEVLIIFAAMPTAISSYILAKELGGDTRLMSSIVTLQTLVSFVTIAMVLSLL